MPPSRPWPPPGYREPQPQHQQPPAPQHQQPPAPPYRQPGPQQPPPPQGRPYPQAPPPQGPPQGRPYPPPPQGQPYPPQGQQWPPQRQWNPPPPPPPPPPGQYRQWPQPPRKKSGGGAIAVIGVLFGSVAVLAVLLVVGSALLRSGSDTDTTTPIAVPSYTPPTRASTREPIEPTRRPTPTESENDTGETVNPPAQVRLDTSLTSNTMYKAGALPRTQCRAGNASIFSHSQLKTLILRTGRCMDKAWGPILEKQGIDWSPPGYAIASKRGRGACGDYPSPGSIVPYYCPRNNTIYASTSAMAKGNGRAMGYGQIVPWNGAIISMMAHEYGHHVQNITGVMNSWWTKTLASSSRSGKLGLSRRLELQATCFGGMFMKSVAPSYPISTANRAKLFWFYSRVGDWPGYPRDHGSPANNHRWFRQGWERNQAFQCNTWMASSSSTS